ncbi:MAG: hypothetical protein M1835_000461 [Candelina submexicana]|nr:MAG: hypothetical protein M1835_000461 [Candelina submexicana]
MNVSTYTPLESLLLFQSLAAYGVEPTSFSKVSDALIGHPQIRDAITFNPSRLVPDALRDLYHRLIKQEIKAEASNRVENDGLINSKKRKIPSPPLASVQDAARQAHLLPQLISRLYSVYQAAIITEIREDEQRYRKLQDEIEGISQGQADGGTRAQNKGSEPSHKRPSTVQELLSPVPGGESRFSEAPISSTPIQSTNLGDNGVNTLQHPLSGSPLSRQNRQSTAPEEPSKIYHTSFMIPATENQVPDAQIRHHGGQAAKANVGPINPAVGSSGRPTSTDSRSSNYSRHYSIPSPSNQASPQVPSPTLYQNDSATRPPSLPPLSNAPTPRLPPPQSSALGYRLASPLSHPTQRHPPPPSYPNNYRGNSPGPRAPHSMQSASPRTPSTSGTLPCPSMNRSSIASSGPLNALADVAGRQYRGPTLPSPSQSTSAPAFVPQGSNNGFSSIHQQSQQAQTGVPLPQNYAQNPYTYNSPKPNFPSQVQQPVAQYYPPSQGGVILPPFQSTPPYQRSDTSKQRPQYFQQQHTSRPSHKRSQLHPALAPNTPSLQTPVYDPPSKELPDTPSAAASNSRRASQLSRLDTSTSSTRWKPIQHGFATQSPGSPTPPWDAFSPISDEELFPVFSGTKKQTPLFQTGSSKQFTGNSELTTKDPKDGTEGQSRTRNARTGGAKGSVHGTKKSVGARSTPSSVVADSVRGRTRSQSTVSHADEPYIDNGAGRSVKNELPTTPAGLPDEEEPGTADNTADEGTRASTRWRRGTLRSLESTHAITKRKRSTCETPDASESVIAASFEIPSSFVPTKPNHVLATRNFPRTCQTIMNDITSHKHAGIFANPVKERDAPGYKDLVYQPQDLKSIKSAIAAGGRAIAAFAGQVGTPAESVESPAPGVGTPTAKKDVNLWLPASLDVVPPKAIINSAQLEKELMRMLANAVMFNLDPDRGFGPAFGKANANNTGIEEDAEGAAVEVEEGGVIKDTREMFDTIEKSVAGWRAAERAVEDLGSRQSVGKGKAADKERDEDDVDELAGDNGMVEEVAKIDDDGEDMGKARKRRKL